MILFTKVASFQHEFGHCCYGMLWFESYFLIPEGHDIIRIFIFWLLMWLALASVLGEDVGGERLIMHPCFESLLTKRYKSRVWCPDLHAPNDHAVLVMGDG